MGILTVLGTTLGWGALLQLSTGIFTGTKARPIDIDCPAAIMEDVVRQQRQSALFAELQRDARHDMPTKTPDDAEPDPVFKALRQPHSLRWMGTKSTVAQNAGGDDEHNVLLLSGGGAWGAFGAAFLAGLRERAAAGPATQSGGNPLLPEFDVITGVSTGAVLGVLLVSGELGTAEADAVAEYTAPKPIGITRSGMLGMARGVIRDGGMTNLTPLLLRLEARLNGKTGADPATAITGLERMAASPTRLLVGTVEASSGAFRIFDLTQLASNGIKHNRKAEAARCIAGIAVASSAVPIQMVPVRLRDPKTGSFKTHVDGGVRLSVFDDHIVSVLNQVEQAAPDSQPIRLYVLRNGITVPRETEDDPRHKGSKLVDTRPDVMSVLTASQANIVNQNELASIALLRLNRPNAPILVATADGYSQKPADCSILPSRSQPFPNEGMKCLARHGRAKALGEGIWSGVEPWIKLP